MKPRILLVEDDPTTSAFLCAAIEALPAEVDAAATCAAAHALADRHRHVLLLIDAHLPDGEGAALLAGLRARGLRAPALAHTAATDRGVHEALIEAGFVEVLCKPLSSADLHAAMRRALHDAPPPPWRIADAGLPAPGRAQPVWDDVAALRALHGQQQHVDALRGLFREELPAARQAVADAVARDDAPALHAALHRLRASCGFVGARRLEAAVLALQEDHARLPDFLAAAQATLSSR